MSNTIVLSKLKIDKVVVTPHPDGGYISDVTYSVQTSDESESFPKQSIKFTADSGEEAAKLLSVGSDAILINFVNAIKTLMDAREGY
tara:strand:- start:1326 stop:1586 length:261 start_codon:yes stop_codon:yes gene_type:complete